MVLRIRPTSFLFMLVSIAFIAAGWREQARADYACAQPAEDFWIVPDAWCIERAAALSPEFLLHCSFRGVKHSWKIDRFLLADRLDGNAICSGSWQQMTTSYLSAEATLSGTDKAVVEVVSKDTGGGLVVAGIWTLGDPPKYKQCFKHWGVPKKAAQAQDAKFNEEQFKAIGNR